MRIKLITLREKKGYTQATFSDAIGISRSHYSQIETGEKRPSYPVSLKIKRQLNYPFDDLFYNPKCPVLGRKS